MSSCLKSLGESSGPGDDGHESDDLSRSELLDKLRPGAGGRRAAIDERYDGALKERPKFAMANGRGPVQRKVTAEDNQEPDIKG